MYGKFSYEIAADKGDNFLNKKTGIVGTLQINTITS